MSHIILSHLLEWGQVLALCGVGAGLAIVCASCVVIVIQGYHYRDDVLRAPTTATTVALWSLGVIGVSLAAGISMMLVGQVIV